MGNVIEMRRRSGPRSETAELLTEMTALETSGKLEGSIHITATKDGTELHILGSCAERLQFAGFTLVKALNAISDRILAAGTAGHTSSPSMREAWPTPKRRLPKRLREATGMGELE